MKNLLLLAILFTVASCGCRHEEELANLRFDNEVLKSTRTPYLVNSYCPTMICQENKILTGCLAFKDNLSYSSIKLTEKQWNFCQRYDKK